MSASSAQPESRLRRCLFFVIVGVLSSVLTVCVLEGFFFVLQRLNAKPALAYTETAVDVTPTVSFWSPDPVLGWKITPNHQWRMTCTYGAQPVFNCVCTSDPEYSRRRVPLPPSPERTRYLLFLGCSFTFGVGLNDDQTLPCQVGQLAPTYRPYNYGVPATGPNYMLAQLQTQGLRSQIPEQDGAAIYTYMDDHVLRTIGSLHGGLWQGADFPYYFLGPDGGLVRKGSFLSGRPFLTRLLRWIGRSRTLSYFHVDLPRVREQDIVLVARVIEAARDQYQHDFGPHPFYVLLYPDNSDVFGHRLLPYLTQAGIPVLDFSHRLKDYPVPAGGWGFPGDHHPTAALQKLVAQWVAERLAQDAPNPH